jgi:hypothetical protein
MFRVSYALAKGSKVMARKNPLPNKFHPLMRWGETYTYAIEAARNELGRQRLQEANQVFARISRIENKNIAVCDVILKRYNPAIGVFADHPISVLAQLEVDSTTGIVKNNVGDQVILKKIAEKNEKTGMNELPYHQHKKNLENLKIPYKCGDSGTTQAHCFGGRYGWDRDVDLTFQNQTHEPKLIKKEPGHYQPHGSSVYYQNRLMEKPSNLAASKEMKEKTGDTDVFRGNLLEFEVQSTVQYAGNNVCPFHKTRVSNMEYIDVEKKYVDGKLDAESVKEHNKAMSEISAQEWQPEYWHEVDFKSFEDIELTHNCGDEILPRIESRRANHEVLNEPSIYEPNLNTSFTRLNPGPELVETNKNESEGLILQGEQTSETETSTKTNNLPEYFKRNHHNSGVKGGAYYQQPSDFYDDRGDGADKKVRIPLRAKWVRDIKNMSNAKREQRKPEYLMKQYRMRSGR